MLPQRRKKERQERERVHFGISRINFYQSKNRFDFIGKKNENKIVYKWAGER